jgi:hypothetical protein
LAHCHDLRQNSTLFFVSLDAGLTFRPNVVTHTESFLCFVNILWAGFEISSTRYKNCTPGYKTDNLGAKLVSRKTELWIRYTTEMERYRTAEILQNFPDSIRHRTWHPTSGSVGSGLSNVRSQLVELLAHLLLLLLLLLDRRTQLTAVCGARLSSAQQFCPAHGLPRRHALHEPCLPIFLIIVAPSAAALLLYSA